MHDDPKDLRKELLREKNPLDSSGSRSRGRGAAPSGSPTKLPTYLGAAALVICLGLIFFLVQLNSSTQARADELTDQLAQLTDVVTSLSEQLEENGQKIGSTLEDLAGVRQRVGAAQSAIRQTTAKVESVKADQERSVQALSSQITTKADNTVVADLDQRSDTKFTEIDGEIAAVQDDMEKSRQAIEENYQQLQNLGLQMTEQGKLVATNGEGVAELRRRGERDYLEFDARKKRRINVGNLTLELRKADTKKQRANFKLFYDDREVERKDIYTNTPVLFYVGRNRVQYEFVINSVTKDRIQGYISVPKGHLPGASPALSSTTQ